MTTILLFLILVALTINHPIHMAFFVGIFVSALVVIKDEKKAQKKQIERKASMNAK